MTDKEYQKLSKKVSPGSPVLTDCLKAFAVGGLICTVGETVAQVMQTYVGVEEKDARLIASLSLVLLSVLLTAFNVYDNIARHAGAGTLVPITGFANAVAAPSIEFKTEGFVLGLGAKMFSIAGPVIAYGTVASVIYGVIYWITTLF